MPEHRCDQPVRILARTTGRREAVRAIGAVGIALVAAQRLDPRNLRDASAQQSTADLTLLASGEAELVPGSLVAWRVVRDAAEVGEAATFEERALGFAVAPVLFTSLLLTDEATGEQVQLDPRAAAFVAEGTSQRRESLRESATSYLRIELVEATTANVSGGDRLFFPGPAFAAPSGPVTLSLQRAEIAEGESVGLPSGAGDTLVLVEQGAVELEVGEAAMRERLMATVGSDTVYAIRSVPSAGTLYGRRDATFVLIATID